MTKIGLLSDTHGYLHPHIATYFKDVDEIWHAGDIGNLHVLEELKKIKPVRAVYGNIDGSEIYQNYPQDLRFTLEGVDVWMTHIGGYPGRYNARVRPLIQKDPPDLFICGHSHILKVIPDPKLNLLHINPGACGKQGWHRVKTILRFALEQGRVKDLEVIELKEGERRGK